MVGKVGRLKPNDGVTGYTDLARGIELEALVCFAESRRLLWQSVGQMDPSERVGIDSQRFVRDVTDQLESLRDHHQKAIHAVFNTRTGATS